MKIENVGNCIINRYLLPTGDGYCLVDTGNVWEFKEFRKKMRKHNIPLSKIKYVALTHIHADHVGFLKELLEETGATLIYDMSTRKRLEAGKNDLNTYISGFILLIISKISAFFVDKTQTFPAVFTDKCIDVSTQPLSIYGIEFITLKGHTTSDTCIKYGDKLLCGDLFMSGISSYKHMPSWVRNKFDIIDSWKKVQAMTGINFILPSHGRAFEKKKIKNCIEYWQQKGVFKLFADN